MNALWFYAIGLLLFCAYCSKASPNFEESWIVKPNSQYINVTLALASISLKFYMLDTSIIADTKRRLAPIKLKASPIPFQNSTEVYLGVYFLFIDDQLLIEDSTTYFIYGTVMRFGKIDGPKFHVTDTGRTLERFLLKLASQSKIIDTQNFHRPLTIYIPDSLFGTTEAIKRYPDFYYVRNVSRGDRIYVYDPRGRRISDTETDFGYASFGTGIFIVRTGSHHGKTAKTIFRK